MTEKKDIHNTVANFHKSLETLQKDPSINTRNKELVTKFLYDCEMGKTVLLRQKKKINHSTLNKYLFSIKVVLRHIKVDFDALSKDDRDNKILETFIRDLETDKIKKLTWITRKTKKGKKSKTLGEAEPYSEKTKREVKLILRKFYSWLYCNNETHPPLVSWIDTRQELKEIPALTREQIEKWITQIDQVRHKALIMLLFDSGTRIGELLNIRKQHLTFDKEQGSYRIRIEFSKTKKRTIWIPIASPFIRDHIESLQTDENDFEQFLFDYTYDYVRKILRKYSLSCLKKLITPHMLRHSSATYYCKKLNRYELCYRYGWSMSSDMPDRYIDREGLVETTTLKIEKQEQKDILIKENQQLKENFAILKDKLERIEQERQQQIDPTKLVYLVLEKLKEEQSRQI